MLPEDQAKQLKVGLFSQKYNLLVGSGISLDAKDSKGNALQSAKELRESLCKITGDNENSPLWRVAGHLTPEQTTRYLTQPYFGCKFGITTEAITSIIWKQIFTLNIDDALENAYERGTRRLQNCVPVNYTHPFELHRNPQEVALVHLHGFTRLPDDRYVFSMQEYARVQRGMNPWIHILSNLVLTEPFIIAGTSLFEPDIEYFLGSRSADSNLNSRAPSILVEPSPDAGTKKDCERFGLTLVQATLSDFIEWMEGQFGPSPSAAEIRAPLRRPKLIGEVSKLARAAFWTDFDFVNAPEEAPTLMPGQDSAKENSSPFFFGRPPTWDDIFRKADVALRSQLKVLDRCRQWYGGTTSGGILCLAGPAGSGKSTSLKRIGHDLADTGFQVFYLKARDGIDVDSAEEFLLTVVDPIILVVDSLAEQADEINSLCARLHEKKRILVLASERQYRTRYLTNAIDSAPIEFIETERWERAELRKLIQSYVEHGLVGDSSAIHDSGTFATKLEDNLVSESICRIMNDYRPMAVIVRSLWNDAPRETRDAFLIIALAHYCHPQGIRNTVGSSAIGLSVYRHLFLDDSPLRLFAHPDDIEFAVPANSTISALLVEEMSREKIEVLLAAFVKLAQALAPYVTRNTIRQHSAEARLGGRLFDADGVVTKLLGTKGRDFYDQTHDLWKWNSRYWEQRALFAAETDLKLGLQHARHAVSIEKHPFPMTTLSKLLYRSAKSLAGGRAIHFDEATELMRNAIVIESRWDRGRTKTAYWVMFDGVRAYVAAGGVPNQRQKDFYVRMVETVRRDHSGHLDLLESAGQVIQSLSPIPDAPN